MTSIMRRDVMRPCHEVVTNEVVSHEVMIYEAVIHEVMIYEAVNYETES